MRVPKDIPEEELQRLKNEKRWSHRRLAIHFRVSESTIRRRLKTDKPERDEKFMQFTNRLVAIAAEAPVGYCQKELLRLVHSLRIRNAMTDSQKKNLVTGSIQSGAREVEEISEDCNFPIEETERVLELLVVERRVERRERGGVLNRGRRKKYHYTLTAF